MIRRNVKGIQELGVFDLVHGQMCGDTIGLLGQLRFYEDIPMGFNARANKMIPYSFEDDIDAINMLDKTRWHYQRNTMYESVHASKDSRKRKDRNAIQPVHSLAQDRPNTIIKYAREDPDEVFYG